MTTWTERLDAMIEEAEACGDRLHEIRLTWAMNRAICRELRSERSLETLFTTLETYRGIPVVIERKGQEDGDAAYFYDEVQKRLGVEVGG